MMMLVAACGGDEESAAPAVAEEPASAAAEEPTPPESETPVEEPPAPVEEPSAPAEPPAEPAPPAETSAPSGGIVRIGWEQSFDFSSGFDPTGEYLGEAMGIMSNLLVRTLVGYKHVAGAEGNEVVDDLAELPEISEDGLTYTFTLKDGVTFGPPLSREITSDDVRFAFERIGTRSVIAQYGFYYIPINGMDTFLANRSDTISGIETPDDKTVVFHLTEPTGDFLLRLAMPAAGPIPREIGSCFTEAGEYGRYLVSSGPYMIAGSDAQDATTCDSLAPLSGFDPDARLEVTRNPDYDPATDRLDARENLPDGFVWELNTNSDDIFAKIAKGELEGEVAGPTGAVVKDYVESGSDRLKIEPGDRTWYITMNLTQAPFDDLNVRRAVNLVMDKAGLLRVWGGESKGEIATHIVPNSMLNDTLRDYDPYPSEGFQGDEVAARAAMALSKYDSDSDGLCDAPECSGVFHLAGTREIDNGMVAVIEQSLAKIGIELTTRQIDDAYTQLQTVSTDTPISSRPGWGKDYADVSTYAVLFDSRITSPEGNINYSLVGMTPELAEQVGASGTLEGVPSVDDQIDACNAMPLGDDRLACWGQLDKTLMEDVVPWVPYIDATNVDIISDAIVQYGYDQFSGSSGYAHWAVDPAQQQG
jgi:peptide/nickel transport system substrate-binding protein